MPLTLTTGTQDKTYKQNRSGRNMEEDETTEYVDITPSNRGYALMLWEIATNSTKAEDREWAKNHLINGYLAGE